MLRRTLLFVLLLACGVAAAAAADPALVTVSGKVEIGHGTPPIWRVAQGGDALEPGDSVRTAAGARAELALGDNRIVRVYEQSVLRVGTSVTPTGAIRSVDLDEGQSIFDVMKKVVADEFDVVTPEIVVSVKGTRFLVAAVGGADYTAVFRGEVGLAGAGFEAVSVRPGLTGARGELFLTPFADPWSAWESDASAPAPALDPGAERGEVNEAIQAALDGSSDSDSGADSGVDASQSVLGSLLGGLLGSERDASAAAGAPADGRANDPGLVTGTTDLLGDLLAPVTDPVAGTTLVAGTTELVGGTTDLLSSLLAPATDTTGTLVPALVETTPGDTLLTPVSGLVGGLLGSP